MSYVLTAMRLERGRGELQRLKEAIRICWACDLGNRGDGVPGASVGPPPHDILILGEAPGAIEQERGKPFVGQSGELLHAMFKECGLESYYVSNIVKHQPYKDRHGKQQAPSKTEIEACAPFLRAEFDLVRPAKLILLGKTAAKFIYGGNFSMKDVVNQTFGAEGDVPALVLYHPAYFLRQRTAPWIQKQIRDWKSAVRLFLGAKAPTYKVEKVECHQHCDPHTKCPPDAQCGQYGERPCQAKEAHGHV